MFLTPFCLLLTKPRDVTACDSLSLLFVGEVPNLFPKDELAGVLDEVRPAGKKEGAGETAEALYAFLLERVRTNLHVILCLSPIGEAFRERCRMFPGDHTSVR